MSLTNQSGNWILTSFGTVVALTLSLSLVWLVRQSHNYPLTLVIGYSASGMIGLLLAGVFSFVVSSIFPRFPYLISTLSFSGLMLFPYLTVVIGLRIVQEYGNQKATDQYSNEPSRHISKVIDTSAIIDGRLLELCKTGFLEGPLLIPRFVLGELHFIADSPQTGKRTRGKRGLEVLNELQNIPELQIQIREEDFKDIPEVDHKLIKLAKLQGAKLVTNDWNLAKVASLEGIQTLNVNQLSYQLKPPVLPGEVVRVLINKEGDLAGQGIAHLDDGTMVVVDQARDYVKETVDIMITKFMQTQSGRILFGSRV